METVPSGRGELADLAAAARELAEALRRLRLDLDDLSEAISNADIGRSYVFPPFQG